MERIRLKEAENRFNKQFVGRYEIVDTLMLGDTIVCCVESNKFIACIPAYYYGYYVRVVEEEKMRDFL